MNGTWSGSLCCSHDGLCKYSRWWWRRGCPRLTLYAKRFLASFNSLSLQICNWLSTLTRYSGYRRRAERNSLCDKTFWLLLFISYRTLPLFSYSSPLLRCGSSYFWLINSTPVQVHCTWYSSPCCLISRSERITGAERRYGVGVSLRHCFTLFSDTLCS